MGFIDNKHRIPTLAETNALKEAEEWGSLKDGGKTFREKLEAEQAKLPSPPPPHGPGVSPAERQFTADIETIQTVADSTTETEIELLARATKSAPLYLAGRNRTQSFLS
jgi:hypothetical protein